MRFRWMTIALALQGIFAQASVLNSQSKQQALRSSGSSKLAQIEVLPSAQRGPRAEDYAQALKQVNSLLGNLQIPEEVKVTIDHVFVFSAFDPNTYTINVGIRPEDMGNKHPSVNLTTLVHEYGHAVFEKNLESADPIYVTLRETLANLMIYEEELENKVSDLKEQIKKTANAAKKTALETQVKDLQAHIYQVEVTRQTLMNHWNLRGAFHELFADIVAVTTSKNPQALRDVLTNIEENYKDQSQLMLNLRDFADGRNHRNRQQWSKDHARIVQEENNLYYAFLPARWEFWQIVKGRIKGSNYQKSVIPKAFAILEKHLRSELSKSSEELRPGGFKNIEALNEKIIQDFHNEL